MEDILDSLEYQDNSTKNYKLASLGQRFANYFIDFIGYMILSMIVGVILGIILVLIGDESILLEEEASSGVDVLELLFGLLVMTSYYTLMEYFFKGKTLGKLITGTRAVTLNNENVDFQTAFIRSICRFIPFEPFSFFGSKVEGWHDTLSKTKVIVDKGYKN